MDEWEVIVSQRKHPEQRHGHRSKAENQFDEVPRVAAVRWPEPDASWHPAAVQWYVALEQSPQAVEYGQSDAATAYLLADDLSRELTFGDGDQPVSGNKMSAFLAGAGHLLATVGSRRAVRMEIARHNEAADRAHLAAVSSLADRRPHPGPDGAGDTGA